MRILKLLSAILLLSLLTPSLLSAKSLTYQQRLCQQPGYQCIQVQKGQSWQKLFPDINQQMLVKKINRINLALSRGMVIAVPNNLQYANNIDFAPFDKNIGYQERPTIIVNPAVLAWGAYDMQGNLVNWGPMSGGQNYCSDINEGCKTIVGDFTVYREGGAGCKSKKFPVGKGGAPMPYCMFFKGGFALHGSPIVPGYHASHGCVRLFIEDAQWLSENFVQAAEQGQLGTRVVVLPYNTTDT